MDCAGDLEHAEKHHNCQYCRRINVEEVQGSIRWMRMVKTARPDKVPEEF